jgi:hypothetical protein
MSNASCKRLPHLGALRSCPSAVNRGVAIENVPADYLRRSYREWAPASRDARYTPERELQRRSMAP